jgi:hypothetical protein
MCPLLKQAIVLLDSSRVNTERQEEEEMNHYMDFDPYLIRERNQQVQRDVHALRLEEQLREERRSSGSRFVSLAKRGVRPLLRAAHLAG